LELRGLQRDELAGRLLGVRLDLGELAREEEPVHAQRLARVRVRDRDGVSVRVRARVRVETRVSAGLRFALCALQSG